MSGFLFCLRSELLHVLDHADLFDRFLQQSELVMTQDVVAPYISYILTLMIAWTCIRLVSCIVLVLCKMPVE